MYHLLETEHRRIQQFKEAVQDENYFDVVEKLIRKAFEKADDVNIYDRASMFEAVPVTDGYVYFLKINKVFENKRRIIYELMHEMGHLFDSISLDRSLDPNSEHPKSERSREIRAWAFADEEFKNSPELQDCIQEYNEHKQLSLLSYEIEM